MTLNPAGIKDDFAQLAKKSVSTAVVPRKTSMLAADISQSFQAAENKMVTDPAGALADFE